MGIIPFNLCACSSLIEDISHIPLQVSVENNPLSLPCREILTGFPRVSCAGLEVTMLRLIKFYWINDTSGHLVCARASWQRPARVWELQIKPGAEEKHQDQALSGILAALQGWGIAEQGSEPWAQLCRKELLTQPSHSTQLCWDWPQPSLGCLLRTQINLLGWELAGPGVPRQWLGWAEITLTVLAGVLTSGWPDVRLLCDKVWGQDTHRAIDCFLAS